MKIEAEMIHGAASTDPRANEGITLRITLGDAMQNYSWSSRVPLNVAIMFIHELECIYAKLAELEADDKARRPCGPGRPPIGATK